MRGLETGCWGIESQSAYGYFPHNNASSPPRECVSVEGLSNCIRCCASWSRCWGVLAIWLWLYNTILHFPTKKKKKERKKAFDDLYLHPDLIRMIRNDGTPNYMCAYTYMCNHARTFSWAGADNMFHVSLIGVMHGNLHYRLLGSHGWAEYPYKPRGGEGRGSAWFCHQTMFRFIIYNSLRE